LPPPARGKAKVRLGGHSQVRVDAPVGRGQQRRHLVHDLVGHLLAHLAVHLDPAGIQIKGLAYDDVKVGAAQTRQVAPEELSPVVDCGQYWRTAAQCQERGTGVAWLQSSVAAAGALQGHGQDATLFKRRQRLNSSGPKKGCSRFSAFTNPVTGRGCR
jgi:hypothetical protein